MSEVSETDRFFLLKKALSANQDLGAAQDEIGGLLEAFLKQVSQTGIPDGFSWADVKAIILAKFNEVTKKFESERPISSLEQVPNVDNYTFEEYHQRILDCLNRFEDTPFTAGRICELLVEPRKHYDRGDKFLRAFEKCVAVTTTNGFSDADANGNHVNGDHQVSGTENGLSNGGETKMESEDATGSADVSTTQNGHADTTTNPEQKLEEPVTHNSVDGHSKVETPQENMCSSSTGSETVATEPVQSGDAEAKPLEQVDEPMASQESNQNADHVTESMVVAPGNSEGHAVSEDSSEIRNEKRAIDESDSVGKKIARFENGDLNGNGHGHAVVGEPEVEPPRVDKEEKKDTGIDGGKAVDQAVVVQENAV